MKNFGISFNSPKQLTKLAVVILILVTWILKEVMWEKKGYNLAFSDSIPMAKS